MTLMDCTGNVDRTSHASSLSSSTILFNNISRSNLYCRTTSHDNGDDRQIRADHRGIQHMTRCTSHDQQNHEECFSETREGSSTTHDERTTKRLQIEHEYRQTERE